MSVLETNAPPSEPLREGVVIQVNKGGLIFLEDSKSRQKYVLTLDKLAGYRGETLRETGLRPGSRLRFMAADDSIEYAEITDDSQKNATSTLTVPEVAQSLRVSEKTVYKLIKQGSLPSIRVGRLMRIPDTALKLFLSAGAGSNEPKL